MCGIAGAVQLSGQPIPSLTHRLQVMNDLIRHRGPDGEAIWKHERDNVGLAHRRLSIIDLSTGDQPMHDSLGNTVTYNGEIYNFVELRQELSVSRFRTTSDTECILKGYETWGSGVVTHLRGMFAFALWDEAHHRLFCARDRFGIKPFYYMVIRDTLYFASEVKALLPFMDEIETDVEGLRDFLTFQLCLDGKTLFKNVRELPPGHTLTVENGVVREQRYWEVFYSRDFEHTSSYFEECIRELVQESVRLHLRADVPVGAYLSGGLDSSVVATLGSRQYAEELHAFTGKFSIDKAYDESEYARLVAHDGNMTLHEVDITARDFTDNIRKIIYHLDYPVAGPGSFPQFMVSKLARQYRKVVLGGQGGDEIFGGYARYLIAYFEQCIKGAIDGTLQNGNFIVTYESIIPNLTTLRDYKPLMQEFWRDGLFDEKDKRYFRLINRAPALGDEIHWEQLGDYQPFDTFRRIFNGDNVEKGSYFDSMTHFDFKTLLPGLLQVEDRVSMAHGLESRVPLLDHPLVELAATIPSDIKFKDGTMKRVFRDAVRPFIPDTIAERKDKMGFPVPLTEWMRGEAHDFIADVFSTSSALTRAFVDNRKVLTKFQSESKYGRTVWGLLCLELWQQEFHDRAHDFKRLITENEKVTE